MPEHKAARVAPAAPVGPAESWVPPATAGVAVGAAPVAQEPPAWTTARHRKARPAALGVLVAPVVRLGLAVWQAPEVWPEMRAARVSAA